MILELPGPDTASMQSHADNSVSSAIRSFDPRTLTMQTELVSTVATLTATLPTSLLVIPVGTAARSESSSKFSVEFFSISVPRKSTVDFPQSLPKTTSGSSGLVNAQLSASSLPNQTMPIPTPQPYQTPEPTSFVIRPWIAAGISIAVMIVIFGTILALYHWRSRVLPKFYQPQSRPEITSSVFGFAPRAEVETARAKTLTTELLQQPSKPGELPGNSLVTPVFELSEDTDKDHGRHDLTNEPRGKAGTIRTLPENGEAVSLLDEITPQSVRD